MSFADEKGGYQNKYKQAKTEANSAQNTLQKEITTLREQNRAIQLRLRDIEVSNDDFERQERIVKSSLEDLEQKYNQGIERGVMMEEEIRLGEQEREQLRIDCQRLKEELSDLKIEQDITLEKLNNAMAMAAKYGHGSLHHVPPPSLQSPMSETSSSVLSCSPTTPTTASAISTSTPQSDHSPTPPSPPMSEISTTTSNTNDPALTPRPKIYQRSRNSRGPSFGSTVNTAIPLPPSRSLHQIRGLIGQMQRLEQRVHHARSKLPGPVNTPPKGSPRNISFIPTTVTIRSHKKTRSPSTASSATSGSDTFNGPTSRLSFGKLERPASRAAGGMMERPGSRAAGRIERPGSRAAGRIERPSSRAAGTIERPSSRAAGMIERPSSRASSRASGTTSRSSVGTSSHERGINLPQRPPSRTSMSGRVTAMGTHAEFGMASTLNKRDRSSIDSYTTTSTNGTDDHPFILPQIRRNTVGKELGIGSAIPKPASGLPRRSFGTRRISSSTDGGDEAGHHGMLGGRDVPIRRKKLSGVGETY